MLTEGQLSSLSAGDGGFSPTACDFEPNNWPNLSPIDGLESDEAPNMLPPPHPERTAPATASANAIRRWRARPAPIVRTISLLRIIQMSPRYPTQPRSRRERAPARYNSAMAANPRRMSQSRNKLSRENPHAAGRTTGGPARRR